MAGEELTVLECAMSGISSAPRRFKDLTDRGVEISNRWQGNVKVWWMTAEQKERNKQ
jgi:hypothetical protein